MNKHAHTIYHFNTKEEMNSFAKDKYNHHMDSPFFMMDLSFLSKQYFRFKKALPLITPYYAIKSNDNPILIDTLHKLGCGFDCASINEILLVKSIASDTFNPDKIIFANPSKHINHIIQAKDNSIHTVTYDSIEELDKLKQYHPNAQLVLRIHVNDVNSKVHLSEIFGAHRDTWIPLIQRTIELNMKLIGICFHVGSISMEPTVFYETLKNCKELFDYCKSKGIELSLLDIGGGFPSITYENVYGNEMLFETFASEINRGLDRFFKEEITSNKVRVIAEPGRFFSSGSTYVFLKIINRKVWNGVSKTSQDIVKEISCYKGKGENNEINVNYYCNESTGLSLSSFLYEDNKEKPCFIDVDVGKENEKENGMEIRSKLYGFSSCKVDLIIDELNIKEVLPVGTKFYFKNLGAYSVACGKGVEVNGVKINEDNIYYFKHKDEWENN